MKLLNEKIKVDKYEYELLHERIEELAREIRDNQRFMFENWKFTRESLYEMMEKYFNNQVHTVIVAQEREQIIAEMRRKVVDNIFGEEKK